MVTHLKWLEENYANDATMHTELEKFHLAFKKLEGITRPEDTEKLDLRDLPPLEDLARPLDRLFFGGLLPHTDYQWITNYADGTQVPHRGYAAAYGAIPYVRVVPVTAWHPDTAKFRDPQDWFKVTELTPQERAH
jgi:hypothetical protein